MDSDMWVAFALWYALVTLASCCCHGHLFCRSLWGVLVYQCGSAHNLSQSAASPRGVHHQDRGADSASVSPSCPLSLSPLASVFAPAYHQLTPQCLAWLGPCARGSTRVTALEGH